MTMNRDSSGCEIFSDTDSDDFLSFIRIALYRPLLPVIMPMALGSLLFENNFKIF